MWPRSGKPCPKMEVIELSCEAGRDIKWFRGGGGWIGLGTASPNCTLCEPSGLSSQEAYDTRFRNGSKTFLNGLGVSNGFPVFLCIGLLAGFHFLH